jgi:RNA polymerase sigma-70 factor, ECF subfamily
VATPPRADVTTLLRCRSDSDETAFEPLLPLVEAERRRLGRGIHDAARAVRWGDRAHFLGISASLIRRVLVDHVRTRGYREQSGRRPPCAIDRGDGGVRRTDVKPRSTRSRIRDVELRFFGGPSIEETADALHVSTDKISAIGAWRRLG